MAFDLAEAYVVIRARTEPLARDLARAESLVEASVSRLNALATLGVLSERAGTTDSGGCPTTTNELTTPVEIGVRPSVDAQQAAQAMRELYAELGAQTERPRSTCS